MSNLNWLGGIVSAVLVFFLGALWYSPKLFGNAWLKHQNKTPEDIKGGSPLGAMGVVLAFNLLSAFLIMLFSALADDSGISFWFLVLVYALVAVTGTMQRMMFEMRSRVFQSIIIGHESLVILVIALAVRFL